MKLDDIRETISFCFAFLLLAGCGMSDADLYKYATARMVYIRGTDCTGSGFIVEDGGEKYLYTCEHCVARSSEVCARLFDGTVIELGEFQVAKDRDLVRYKINAGCHSFSLAMDDDLCVGTEIVAFGDSQGGGVMTSTAGKILAKGVDKIEIDAGVQPGNSGGPILTRNGNVCGVVSSGLFRHDEMTKGTRYDNTRRFAEKVVGTKWETVDFNGYYREWLRIKDIEYLCGFMEQWNGAFWKSIEDGLNSDVNIMAMVTALKKILSDDGCERIDSMYEMLSSAQQGCMAMNNMAKHFQRFNGLIENGSVRFPYKDEFGTNYKNRLDFEMQYIQKNGKVWNYVCLLEIMWYTRAILDCEENLKLLHKMRVGYGGDVARVCRCVESTKKKMEVLKDLFVQKYRMMHLHDCNDYVLQCRRFGEIMSLPDYPLSD